MENRSENAPLVLILGGAGAIGSAIAREQQARGSRVVVLDKATPANEDCHYVNLDITSEEEVTKCFAEMDRQGLVPDALIVATGYLKGGDFDGLRVSDIADHIEINAFGAFRVAQACLKRMTDKGGRMLFLSSVHGHIGVSNRCAYAMSKAALEAMARAIAVEYAHKKIRVNVLAPGAVDSGMNSGTGMRQYWTSATPAGRVATVEEIARFAAVMTSDDASFVSGQTIHINGGVNNLRYIV